MNTTHEIIKLEDSVICGSCGFGSQYNWTVLTNNDRCPVCGSRYKEEK